MTTYYVVVLVGTFIGTVRRQFAPQVHLLLPAPCDNALNTSKCHDQNRI